MAMTRIEVAAAKWFTTASAADLAAFRLFQSEGCPSCGSKATPACACWTIRAPRYLEMTRKVV